MQFVMQNSEDMQDMQHRVQQPAFGALSFEWGWSHSSTDISSWASTIGL
jgi:hypothetical protein